MPSVSLRELVPTYSMWNNYHVQLHVQLFGVPSASTRFTCPHHKQNTHTHTRIMALSKSTRIKSVPLFVYSLFLSPSVSLFVYSLFLSPTNQHLYQAHVPWGILQHCTGFARLVWGRLRVHRAFVYSDWFVCYVCFCSLLPRTQHMYQAHSVALSWRLEMTHVTHMNDSCHTYEWLMSHIRISRVIHVCGAFGRGLWDGMGWLQFVGCLKW